MKCFFFLFFPASFKPVPLAWTTGCGRWNLSSLWSRSNKRLKRASDGLVGSKHSFTDILSAQQLIAFLQCSQMQHVFNLNLSLLIITFTIHKSLNVQYQKSQTTTVQID